MKGTILENVGLVRKRKKKRKSEKRKKKEGERNDQCEIGVKFSKAKLGWQRIVPLNQRDMRDVRIMQLP